MADIPLAVAPSVRSPGLGLTVDLKAGVPSPGTGALRALIMGSASGAGTATDDILYQAVAGEDALGVLAGPGTPAHLAGKRLWEEYPLALVDFISPPDPGGTAASATVTFGGSTPTTNQTVVVVVAGREVTYTWAAGVTATNAAVAFDALVDSLTNDLPVSATNSTGVVTLTFKLTGPIGNDCLLRVKSVSAGVGTVVASAANLGSGATEPDFSDSLDAVKLNEYHLIVPCVSNADAAAASATSNIGRIKTHIDAYDTGMGARLQQCVVGHTGAPAATKTGTGQHNYEYIQYVAARGFASLPCELAGAEAGARLRDEAVDPAVNRIQKNYQATLYPSHDLPTNAYTAVESEDLLQTGVTPVTYDTSGNPRPDRPVTSYHKDGSGNPDDRVTDVSRASGVIAVARDLRVFLPSEFQGAKIVESFEEGDDAPDGVIEIREVKEAIEGRMDFWIKRGVVTGAAWKAAVADGSFICRINPSDETQVDLYVPTKIVRPLAKFSLAMAGR